MKRTRKLVAYYYFLHMFNYYKCSVALPQGAVGCLQCVIVVFPDHTHLLFVQSSNLFPSTVLSKHHVASTLFVKVPI